MLQDLRDIGLLRPIDAGEVLSSLLVSLFCGLIIAWIYRRTYRGTSYAPSFVRSMVVLPMITALVILVIGNNLARAFGLVGAMSIIRFRTAVKDIHDIVFIFFTLAVGLAAGVGMHAAAWIATIAIGLTVMATTSFGFGRVSQNAMLLEFEYAVNGSSGDPTYQTVLDRHCKFTSVLSVRQPTEGETLLLTFHVRLRRGADVTRLVRELRDTERVARVNLYYDDEEL